MTSPTGSQWPRLAAIAGWLVALNARHRQRLTLHQLDDRILRDVGLTRADVAHGLRAPLAGRCSQPAPEERSAVSGRYSAAS